MGPSITAPLLSLEEAIKRFPPVGTNATPKAKFLRAADIIESMGWITHCLHRSHEVASVFAQREGVCLLGALCIAADGNPYSEKGNGPHLDKMVEYLNLQQIPAYMDGCAWRRLVHWNNNHCTSGAQAIKTLRDMAETLPVIIKITQDHIDRGTGKSCGSCPIALAGSEVLQEVVLVSSTRLYLSVEGAGADLPCYNLPPEAQDFITNFDMGNPVVPFEFELGPKHLRQGLG